MMLGGRVAEEIVFGEITTGAKNDLERATELSRKIVMEFGMTERFGPITFGRTNEHVFLGRDFGHERDYSESVAGEIDDEIRKIIIENYDRAKDILTKNKTKLIKISNILIEKETLDAEEIERLVKEIEEVSDIDISFLRNPPKEEVAVTTSQISLDKAE